MKTDGLRKNLSVRTKGCDCGMITGYMEAHRMDKFLSIISDIRVVIAIAVIVLLLTIWLISQKIRTKKYVF